MNCEWIMQINGTQIRIYLIHIHYITLRNSFFKDKISILISFAYIL